jgi:hypothetical protein
MVYFQIKNRILGKLGRVFQSKMLVYVMDIWSILCPFNIFYGHLLYLGVLWYIFPRFGILYQVKSGSPARV